MSDVDTLSRRRRILIMVAAGSFLAWQVPMMDVATRAAGEGGWANILRAAGFLVWAASLVALLALWRGRAKDRRVREALEDELTRANRRTAFAAGYWATLLAAGSMFALSLMMPVSGAEAAHIVLVVAVVAPMFRFAALERPLPAE